MSMRMSPDTYQCEMFQCMTTLSKNITLIRVCINRPFKKVQAGGEYYRKN